MMLPQNCNLTSDRTALSEKDGFHSEVAHLSSAFHFIFLNQSRPLGSTCIAVKDNLSEALSTDNFQGIIWIPVDFLPQLRTSMLHSHLHLRKVIQSHWSGCALSSLNWHKKKSKKQKPKNKPCYSHSNCKYSKQETHNSFVSLKGQMFKVIPFGNYFRSMHTCSVCRIKLVC